VVTASRSGIDTTQEQAESAAKQRPLIANYGLYWGIEHVHWGKQGPNGGGKLLGRQRDKSSSQPVDFREQIGIYVLYADYKLVYVGQAGVGNAKLFERLRYHRNVDLQGRWNQFSWFGLRRVLKKGNLAAEATTVYPPIPSVLNHIEAVLIHTAEPALNRQGGRFGRESMQYVQYRDVDLVGLTQDERLTKLCRDVEDVQRRLDQLSGYLDKR